VERDDFNLCDIVGDTRRKRHIISVRASLDRARSLENETKCSFSQSKALSIPSLRKRRKKTDENKTGEVRSVGVKRSSWISFGFDGELREQSFHQKEQKLAKAHRTHQKKS
jgi:hypothetical protein